MLHDLVKRTAGRKPLFVSDELPHYANILAELYHKMVPIGPTGKRGRPKNPQCVIETQTWITPQYTRPVKAVVLQRSAAG